MASTSKFSLTKKFQKMSLFFPKKKLHCLERDYTKIKINSFFWFSQNLGDFGEFTDVHADKK